MIGKLDQALGFHETALRIRAQRHELIAANIANADTPNFKAKDIDFAGAFRQALAGSNYSAQAGAALQQTSPAHMAAQAQPDVQHTGHPSRVQYRSMIQGSVDGNTVDMDVERNQFADNVVRYEASLVMLNGQLKKLMSAIQGQ